MSEKMPVVSGRQVVKALGRAGFRGVRQKGSHVRLEKLQDGKMIKLTVPVHETLKKGTLKGIISDPGMTTEQFLGFLG